jgi:hypothetical protein
MGYRNIKTPDHHRPQPKHNLHPHKALPVMPKPCGKTKGHSKHTSPAFYIVFISLLALGLAAAAMGAQ